MGLNTDETAIILQEQLLATQNTSGGWEAMNFIKPKAYEPYKSYYVLFKNPNSILHFPQNLYHFLKSLCNKDATISLVSFGELIVPMLFFYLLFSFLKGIFWKK